MKTIVGFCDFYDPRTVFSPSKIFQLPGCRHPGKKDASQPPNFCRTDGLLNHWSLSPLPFSVFKESWEGTWESASQLHYSGNGSGLNVMAIKLPFPSASPASHSMIPLMFYPNGADYDYYFIFSRSPVA